MSCVFHVCTSIVLCVAIDQHRIHTAYFDWLQPQRQPEDTKATTWLYTPTAHQPLTTSSSQFVKLQVVTVVVPLTVCE